MVLTVAMDTRDLRNPAPRGSTRYARDLLAALEEEGDLGMRGLDGAGDAAAIYREAAAA